jgi:hypothetical protein
MMSPSDLAGLTVERFWKGFNWLGLPPQLEPLVPEEKEPTNWMESSLCEFLREANWSGRRAPSPRPASKPAAPLLTRAVGEYFQALPWLGRDEKTPPALKQEPISPGVRPPGARDGRDFSATDLSNLF